jgi:hypothetical protein
MHDRSLPQGERGAELLLEHCTALTRVPDSRPPAFHRLEQELGNDLARRLVVALASRRSERAGVLV